MATEQTTPTTRRPSWIAILLAWAVNIAAVVAFALMVYLFWPIAWAQFHGQAVPPASAPTGNVGGQAPPSIRSTYQNTAPISVATPIPDLAQNAATAEVQYNAAVESGESAPPVESFPTPDLGPLPLNDAGAPVIDAMQQQQLNQSAELAAQEAQAEIESARATDIASRPPDVSYADAEALLHRDPCHVPRADPHTCQNGLYKPTPIGAP